MKETEPSPKLKQAELFTNNQPDTVTEKPKKKPSSKPVKTAADRQAEAMKCIELKAKGLNAVEISRIVGIDDRTVLRRIHSEIDGIDLAEFQKNEADINDFFRARDAKIMMNMSDAEYKKKVLLSRNGALWHNSHFNNARLLREESTANVRQQVIIVEHRAWKPDPRAKPSDPINKIYDVPDEIEELPCPDDGATDIRSVDKIYK